MIIYLIRHGETTINRQARFLGHLDVALSEHGIKQAKHITAVLDDINISNVYSSDLKRAFQTALFIAGNKQLTVETKAGLREIDFGEWEGLTYEEIIDVDSERITAWLKDFKSVKIPGGESWRDFTNRVIVDFINIVDSAMDEQSICIVTHGGPIRLITSCLIEDEDHFMSFWPAPGSVHMINITRKMTDYEIMDETTGTDQAQCSRQMHSYELVDYHLNLQES